MSDNLCKRVAKRVRFHRTGLGFSRRVLSEKTGISERYLAQLEAGKANISLLLLDRITKALDVELVDIIKTERSSASIENFLSKLSDAEKAKAQLYLKKQTSSGETTEKSIALIGLRGAGKSALGKKLARDIHLPFVRLSDRIEELVGRDIETLIKNGGTQAYRKYEKEALEKLLMCPGQRILEVSGGIIDSPDSYELLLNNFQTVYIKALPEEHIERVAAQKDPRPASDEPEPVKFVKAVISKRDPMYKKADFTVDTSGQSEAKSFSKLKATIEKSIHLH